MAAQIDKPILPPILYRYRGLLEHDHDRLHREMEAIRERTIYCSHYRRLNDPMEGFYTPSLRLQTDSSFTRTAKRTIYQAKQDIGICCFSDTCDNELMWTHYASNYSGICVGYRTKQLVDGLPEDVHLVRVAYDGVPPTIGKHDLNPHETAVRILSHKKMNWQYEREWRVLATLGPLQIDADNCIAEVRLGRESLDTHRTALLNAFGHGGIRISTMTVHDYRHTWMSEPRAAAHDPKRLSPNRVLFKEELPDKL